MAVSTMSVEIITREGLTEVRFLAPSGHEEVRETIFRSRQFPANGLELWDFTASGFDLHSPELLAHVWQARSKPTRPRRCALIADKSVDRALMREFATLRTEKGIETRVFDDVDSARSWLTAGD